MDLNSIHCAPNRYLTWFSKFLEAKNLQGGASAPGGLALMPPSAGCTADQGSRKIGFFVLVGITATGKPVSSSRGGLVFSG